MSGDAQFRDRFAPAVLANRLRVDPLWLRPCLAYNVHARPDDSCRHRLTIVQDELARLGEVGLLRCPPASLHVSLGSFLFVREDYVEPKEKIWARHGERWVQGLTSILGRVGAFALSYGGLVVTDSAVVALATRPPEVEAIREGITALRSAGGFDGSQPTIVHTTLFRYGTTLRDPAAFLAAAESILVDAECRIREVVVTREVLYPSVVTEDVARLPLSTGEA